MGYEKALHKLRFFETNIEKKEYSINISGLKDGEQFLKLVDKERSSCSISSDARISTYQHERRSRTEQAVRV